MNSTPLLHERVALITGASRGIGRAIAAAFCEHGAKVVISATGETLLEVEQSLREAGREVVALIGDVRDDAHLRELVSLCKRTYGRLDVLVNNAGIMVGAPLGMISRADLDGMLAVNVQAVVQLSQYASRLMGRTSGGSIVNLASIAGTRGMDGAAAYSATKGAIVSFTRAAARELAPRGIRVNAIAPGFIDTAMTRSLQQDWYDKRMQSIPMGRIGTPEDVAGCAVFLASDLSSYVTGQIIGVDGGMVC